MKNFYSLLYKGCKNKKIVLWVLHFVPPLILTIGVEVIHNGSFGAFLQWNERFPNVFFINYGIALFYFILLWSIIGNVYLSLGTYFFTGILLALLNLYKIKFLGDPIYPWDIILSHQVINLFPNIYKETNIIFPVFLVVFLIFIILLTKWLPSLRLNIMYRIFGGLVSLFLLISLSYYNSTPLVPLFKKLGVSNVTWFQNKYNYKENGLFLSFFMNMQSAIVFPPYGYNKKNIINIENEFKNKKSSQTTSELPIPSKKPNVIFVMNESFSDPTLLKNVTFSSDPLPNFHKLLTTGNASWMLSPQIGGYTANVEFEVLTGFNMTLLPYGAIPYEQYVNHPIPSLASYFTKEGYKTIGIHPYDKKFWNREKVYKYLGFQNFISLEQFQNPKKSGGSFVDDSEVTNSIIQQVTKVDEPVFIYAVTMQNHGTYHYSDHNYPIFPINVSGSITNRSKESLFIYSNGVFDGDKQIHDLISYFTHSTEPTILIFFGDHLPKLSVYNETEFVSPDKNMNTTPLIIWTNYGKQSKHRYNTVSASFLGTYVFELAGIKAPLFFSFLENFRDALPGYNPNIKIDREGKISTQTPEALRNFENEYQLLQYDLLFGSQFAGK